MLDNGGKLKYTFNNVLKIIKLKMASFVVIMIMMMIIMMAI